MYDVIVVGSGYAGSIMARKFADIGKKVLVLERRNHIGGNMYDEKDKNGILVHKYGPHIAYMNIWRTYDFLSQYTEFVPYQHHVNAEIDGVEVPLPFNLNSIDKLFELKKALKLKEMLIKEFGMDKKVPILELRKSKKKEIRDLAEYIYEKVFLDYTTKMWGKGPEELDPAITGRVPVHVSYDDRHFTQLIQVMPKHGYTEIFKKMLNHKNIEIELNVEALGRIKLDNWKILYKGKEFKGTLIFTGAIDELMNEKYGKLPYRSLYFEHKTYKVDRLQSVAVINWPDKRSATRRTENKLLVCQPNVPNVTSTITEYPGEYNKKDKKWNDPYYPIIEKENIKKVGKYFKEAEKYKNLVLIGRLAEYKYYNMEAVILATLDKFEELKKKIDI
ncbi:MAG: hypothetical protein XD93_0626 [candidate division WS6 bacterium 34_10]|uniref:UDP-galactopyranose mutase C-terminal domain-containing protein n=1 Tax=candidate division WS6 bacterium 34_10 TaxID=1641389 RepID=A0A101HHL9_9BACT|nr:MAG: hypothetical protein XD93_0626 [candidate division WS6 bacterium 34_10]